MFKMVQGGSYGGPILFLLNIFSLIISFNFQSVPPYQYILSFCILKCFPSLSLSCPKCSNKLLPPTSLLGLSFCSLKCWPSRNVVGLYLSKELISEFGAGAFIEPTCAYARWAHMHRFLSVRLSVRLSVWTRQKIRLENNSYLKKY